MTNLTHKMSTDELRAQSKRSEVEMTRNETVVFFAGRSIDSTMALRHVQAAALTGTSAVSGAAIAELARRYIAELDGWQRITSDVTRVKVHNAFVRGWESGVSEKDSWKKSPWYRSGNFAAPLHRAFMAGADMRSRNSEPASA